MALTDTDPGHGTHDLVALAGRLAAEFARDAAARDAERRLPHAEMRLLAASGLGAARVPVRYGGPGASIREVSRIIIALAKADPNIAQALQPHYGIADLIHADGTDEQRSHWLGRIRDGALFASANAERAGPFVGHIAATLSTRDGRLVLNGRKFYATGSPFADLLHVTADRAEDGQRVFVFVPPERRGVRIDDDWNGMGQRLTGSGTVTLDQVVVEPIEVLAVGASRGPRNHFGSFAQLRHAAIDAGIAAAAFDDACRAARELARPLPEAGVASARDDPYVLQTIGELGLQVSIATTMVERAAQRLDSALALRDSRFEAGHVVDSALIDAAVAIAEARVATDHASLRVAEGLYRVAGASATDRSLNFDRHWRNARTHTTHDPIAWKSRLTGDFYLNGRVPPAGPKF